MEIIFARKIDMSGGFLVLVLSTIFLSDLMSAKHMILKKNIQKIVANMASILCDSYEREVTPPLPFPLPFPF